jgi:hypothetical protein
MPAGATMKLTHVGQLEIPPCGLPPVATATHLFPALTEYSLISVAKFCDHGYAAIFTAEDVQITMNGSTILRGT